MSGNQDNNSTIQDSKDEKGLKSDFSDRFASLLREKSLSQSDLIRLTGEHRSKISAYIAGERLPSVETAIALADALGVTVPHLIYGREEVVGRSWSVPLLEVRFSGGPGTYAEGEPVARQIPLANEILHQIRRTTTDGLAFVGLDGDSMYPVIADGGLVLIDLKDRRLREGIFAFRAGDDLRIKRLRPVGLGDIEAISENPVYPPERYTGLDKEQIAIIGRALWAGTPL
jgi:transcriptional regulator with XRE-family HTH domain